MPGRRIWVKRPDASATLVRIQEHVLLVDELRDMILLKYANSLGRTFDSPDMVIRITTKSEHHRSGVSRMLGPDEDVCRVLDTYYPNGQTVDEALLIETPSAHTSQMPGHAPTPLPEPFPYNTIAPLPSPGVERLRAEAGFRPLYGRQHSSPPASRPSLKSAATAAPFLLPKQVPHRLSSRTGLATPTPARSEVVPVPPPLPDPPTPQAPPTAQVDDTTASLNGAALIKPNRPPAKPRKSRKGSASSQTKSAPRTTHAVSLSTLEVTVPPINVLLVEDNTIALRALQKRMETFKVRCQSAENGRIAVDKWKTGGFHLVLMDIQMPVMNGLEATKEIRRLERANGIGVFAASATESETEHAGERAKPFDPAADKLDMESGLFKSPVIIVALTASSLQSDRHDALAAGCNDFLTKPLDKDWVKRKITEWGCMQALIDYEGWRKWKQFTAEGSADNSTR
ncbi:CheY, CheY-like receiver [Teratosphaeria destructans]|uniref:CheY, CheY-like receiver n=1 Tax=Teratosphaeria destructans TaxID=418781 RepID=A0A9W7SNT7_9PEZI|nr:CheY, CheY-like receiver [Teratosphaeria destructans]